MIVVYKNKEGYADPTAAEAIGTVTKEEKKQNEEVAILVNILKQMISLAGFEMVGRITLRDKKTGKEYKQWIYKWNTRKGVEAVTEQKLLAVQRDNNKLKSLHLELANHENFNPYKRIIMFDIPKGEKGKLLMP